MLTKRVDTRLTLRDVMQHEWVTEEGSNPMEEFQVSKGLTPMPAPPLVPPSTCP